jgi:stearoyl-CoA desaturase (delta-9 desaturase)
MGQVTSRTKSRQNGTGAPARNDARPAGDRVSRPAVASPPGANGSATSASEAAKGSKVSGIVVLDEKQERFQRRMTLVVTIVPFAGFLMALLSMWGWGISGVNLTIFVVAYAITGLGVTVGFHRHLTHGSFDAPRPIRAALSIAGSLAVEGSVISWVAAHRRHHAFADKEGDPHSPHLAEEEGFLGILKALWHAHVGWLFSPDKSSPQRWAPDLVKDPMMRRIDSLFPLWVVISFTLPALVGLVVTQSVWGAVTAFLWGSLARIFMLHHVTWSINSICHYYGDRPFRTPDESTNNWLLSLVSFGESWHNNHHAFPSSAVHGIGRWQLDLSAMTITLLEKLGLARNVRRVSPKLVERKRA